ncbi:MAG: hypothetical protein JOY96_08810 [Verrucomicrobia bacterium]|nr:hypothetical protein [Verrucomicrobiota bacterium]MBV9674489.1 hypothetical protein [Verrucomicrobiota bacterium]
MDQATLDATHWAQRTAARLSMVQTSFADDPPDVRKGFLSEELKRLIKEIPENQRREYLARLGERFPRPERARRTVSVAPPPPPVELSLIELADELISRKTELNSENRAILIQKLHLAGFLVARERGMQLPPELLAKIGLTPEQELDNERLARLFAALLDVVVTLDHLIWVLWKTLAPKSIVRREAGANDLRKSIGRYLSGDREVATLQITQMLDKTRQLIGGILSAIGPAGETYARRHLQTFAPEKIRAAVEAGNSGFLSSVEQKCWRKYVDLASALSGPEVEKQIVDAIVSYTEELISRPELRSR